MRLLKLLPLVALAAGLSAGTARADVKPHPIFSDHMVLQRGVDLTIWGKADPGEKVEVTLVHRVAQGALAAGISTTADKDGGWRVNFPKQEAGTGYSLQIKGKNTVEFKNVAVGEVWVCSGQSNMEWSVNAGETPDKVKAAAENPNLRLFTVKKRTSIAPITDQNDLGHFTKWDVSGPDTVGGFSAVGYHFGQKLQKELGVPVGLIHSSWGGTPAEAWTSLEALEAVPGLKHYAAQAQAAAKKFEGDKKQPGPNVPTVLYNAMIYPLLKFPVKGAIWYQGESNNNRAFEYRTLLPTMIKDWRKGFGCELPFMIVQLAAFGNGNSSAVTYAELRDAQLNTAKELPKVGLAVAMDIGHETDIHPKPKQPVGERLALAALKIAYDKTIVHSGPTVKAVKFDGGAAHITFDNVGGGLVAKDGDLAGFTIAGKDGKFHPAKAIIQGDEVIVSSEQVPNPAAVRYGWANYPKPTINLFNKEGLPASPFRTDDFPLTTAPKKQ
jgi:sialate O-acetylesterase